MNSSDKSKFIADAVRNNMSKEDARKHDARQRKIVKRENMPESKKIIHNNLRAIGIHFALSTVGMFVIFFAVQSLLFLIIGLFNLSDVYWVGYALGFSIMIVALLAYIACGYFFLKPVKEENHLSVAALVGITGFAGIVFAILYALTDIPIFTDAEAMGEALSLLVIGLNSLGYIVASRFLEIRNPVAAFFSVWVIVIASLLPPILLYSGLRLKIWRENKQQATERRP